MKPDFKQIKIQIYVSLVFGYILCFWEYIDKTLLKNY